MENEFIDLGREYGMDSMSVSSDKPASKVDYPTLYISHDSDDSGLDDLPDGEFTFLAKGKIKRYTEDYENGKCSCEIEVHGIKPMGMKEKKRKESEESLSEIFEEIISSKLSK